MNNKKPCLALLMPGFYEQIVGGSEYQSYLLAEYAIASGMDVHYIFIDQGGPFENRLGIELHPLNKNPFPKTFGSTIFLYARQIIRLLRSIQPTIVYVKGGYSWAGIATYFARRNRCKSILHIGSEKDIIHSPMYSMLTKPFDILNQKMIEFAIHHSMTVITQAKYQVELLQKYYDRNSEVILQMQPEPEEPLDKGKPLTIVWVANIKPLKQPNMFIQLARELQYYENVRFVMIGRPSSDKYQHKLDSEIQALKNLEYIGEQTIDRVNEILSKYHIFVNTSTYEGFPNTFVQAWMRKVPVVSMLVDPDDILKTRKIGYFSGSFEQMVKDVRGLIENATLRYDMGKRAREYALENHSLKKNMKQLLNLMYPKEEL